MMILYGSDSQPVGRAPVGGRSNIKGGARAYKKKKENNYINTKLKTSLIIIIINDSLGSLLQSKVFGKKI
jgi:hypothetical protein